MTSKMPLQVANDVILKRFYNWVYRKDYNVLFIVCGKTGRCKSGSAITLAHLIDRDVHNKSRFSLNRVVFHAKDFLTLVRSNLPKGSVIIWDEIGVEQDSRDFYTLRNRLIKKVFQTFRYQNLIVIMTVPDMPSVDVGVRRLLHAYLEMKGKVRSGKAAYGRFFWYERSPREETKAYYKLPRYRKKGFSVRRKMNFYIIPRPPLKLENAYKAKKQKVAETWYDHFDKELDFMRKQLGEEARQQEDGIVSLKTLRDLVLKDTEKYLSEKGKFLPALIQAYCEVSHMKARLVASVLNAELAKGEVSLPVRESAIND